MNEWADHAPFAQLSYKIASTTGSAPLSLMLGRRLNDFEQCGRANKTKGELQLALWRKRIKELNDAARPAVKERILEKKGKMASSFNKKRRMLTSDASPSGAIVMMVDKTRASKWDPICEGTFTVPRKNRGGAYMLRGKGGEVLKRSAPGDQLKMVKRSGDAAVIEAPSFKIKEITSHRHDDEKKLECYVAWKDASLLPGWEPVANFDDIDVIRQCWKKIRPTRGKSKKSQ